MKFIILFIVFSSCSDIEKKETQPGSLELVDQCSIEFDSEEYLNVITSLPDIKKTIVLWRKEDLPDLIIESDYKSNFPLEIGKIKIKSHSEKKNELILKLKKVSCETGKFVLTTKAKNSFSIEGNFNLDNNNWEATVTKNIEI